MHLNSRLIRGVAFGRSGLIRGYSGGRGMIGVVFGGSGMIGVVFGGSSLMRAGGPFVGGT